jgi:hypothetical protein
MKSSVYSSIKPFYIIHIGLMVCATLFSVSWANAQGLGGYSVAGMNGYSTTTSTETLYSAFYSNSGGTGVSKEIHLKLNNVATGDSIILVSDTAGFEVICRKQNTSWLSVLQKTLGGTPNYSGQRNGFVLTSGDTSIQIEIRHNRTTTMASSTPKVVRILYKRSSNGTINTAYYDFAPRMYTLTNVYRWTGASSKDFSTSTNWSPERSSPATSDMLIVDQYDTADIEIKHNGSKINQEIGQLMVTNFTRVRFTNYRNNGDNSISTLQLGTANTNQHNFEVTTSGYPSVSPSALSTFNGDLTLGQGSEIFVSGTDTVCFFFKAGAVYKSNNSGANVRKFMTKNDRGSGAVLKFYFVDDITGLSTLGNTCFKTEANTAIYLDGEDNVITGFGVTQFFGIPSTDDEYIGGAGTVVVGPRTRLYFPDNDNNKWYLGGRMLVYGQIHGNIVSNSPSANTETAWNNWEPYLQIGNNGIHKGSIASQTHPWVSGGNLSITGGVKWQMYNSGNRAWRTVGFPFEEMHVSQISRNIVVTGTRNTDNKDSFYSFNSSCTHCRTSLYGWDENSEEWSGFESGTSANKLSAGQGVLLFFRGLGSEGLGDASASATAGVMNFKGTPVIGDKTVSLSYNSNGNSLKGINLVANPYMSNVDWNELTRSNVADKFYFYDPAGKMYNVYDNTGSSLVVDGTTNYKAGSALQTRTIEQGSAFFAIATGSSAEITFKEEAKIATQGSASAFREERIFPCNRLSMNLKSTDAAKLEMDHATLEWNMSSNGASVTQDVMDMPKIYGGYYGIGTVDAKGEWYVVDRRPDVVAGVIETLPLKIATHEKTASYKISFETCPEGADVKLTLVDRLKGEKHAINSHFQYVFDKKEGDALLTEERFSLELENTSLSMSTTEKLHVASIYPNPITSGVDRIFVAVHKNEDFQGAQLFDINGKLVGKWNASEITQLSLNLPKSLSTGVYMLNVQTLNGSSQHKLSVIR